MGGGCNVVVGFTFAGVAIIESTAESRPDGYKLAMMYFN
jgi:hypothetical protein